MKTGILKLILMVMFTVGEWILIQKLISEGVAYDFCSHGYTFWGTILCAVPILYLICDWIAHICDDKRKDQQKPSEKKKSNFPRLIYKLIANVVRPTWINILCLLIFLLHFSAMGDIFHSILKSDNNHSFIQSILILICVIFATIVITLLYPRIGRVKKGDKRIFITPLSLINFSNDDKDGKLTTNLEPFLKFIAAAKVKEGEDVYILFSNGHVKEGAKTFFANIGRVNNDEEKEMLETIINNHPVVYYSEKIVNIEETQSNFKQLLIELLEYFKNGSPESRDKFATIPSLSKLSFKFTEPVNYDKLDDLYNAGRKIVDSKLDGSGNKEIGDIRINITLGTAVVSAALTYLSLLPKCTMMNCNQNTTEIEILNEPTDIMTWAGKIIESLDEDDDDVTK